MDDFIQWFMASKSFFSSSNPLLHPVVPKPSWPFVVVFVVFVVNQELLYHWYYKSITRESDPIPLVCDLNLSAFDVEQYFSNAVLMRRSIYPLILYMCVFPKNENFKTSTKAN